MARILIADDDRFLIELWERVLSRQGHEVFVFDDGDLARDALTEPDAAYDLVLAGLRLQGTSGLDLLRTARLLLPGVPVILCAASWLEEERRDAERAGVSRMLNKPLDPILLTDVLAELLARAPAAGVGAAAAAGGVVESVPVAAAKAGGPIEHPDERAPSAPSARGSQPGLVPSAPSAPSAAPQAAPPARSSAPASAPDFAADLELSLVPLAPPLVLVVERDAVARRLLGYCLERQGFRVADAQGRQEGLELAEMDTPDAVVFGDAEEGLALGEALRRLRGDPSLAGIPVIAIYEAGSTAEAVSALDGGADLALERPYEPDVLFAHIRAAIRRRAAARSPGRDPATAAPPLARPLAAGAAAASPASTPSSHPPARSAVRHGGDRRRESPSRAGSAHA